MIRYDISPLDPEAHIFIVAIRLSNFSKHEQRFTLPSWINGSYVIRDYASHIQNTKAFIDNKPCPIGKTAKDTWSVQTGSFTGELTIIYEVYAFDASVRGAYLDSCRGFFNPGAVFMHAEGFDSETLSINIANGENEMHPGALTWKVATSMPRAEGTERYAWGLYEADSYEDLLDYPVELSDFTALNFSVYGTRHDIIINATPANFDAKRLLNDIKRLCEYEICFFEPTSKQCPVHEYVFLLNVTSTNYGGLEHKNSAALCAPAKTLPCSHDRKTSDDYATLLGLFAHEYFHTWFVKRIKPHEFIKLDLSKEVPTQLLWLFEGFTSYYDDLILKRCHLITDDQYADALSANFKALYETPARNHQTLAESSFDAWIKFYKPNANSVNSTVSYYRQGALCALALDLTIRRKTKNNHSLDDFMRALWQQYKKDGLSYTGLREADVPKFIKSSTSVNCTRLVNQLTKTTCPFNYERLLKYFGACLKPNKLPLERQLLGIDGTIGNSGFEVKHVFDAEPGQWAGIAPGDTLIAIDGTKLTPNTFGYILSRYSKGDEMVIHAFRDDSMLVWTILIGKPVVIRSVLKFEQPSELRQSWLN